ncbi:hypothetical protein [Luteibacter yeojuensis]|uniref:Tetratricopeptide repeat protein n=1 Tax=Luteibacter yeojuensis TaxID=345309 RepID=A0A0F3KI87_9GAMM|nr:hypothetical protein [Luteibacter yeojuensis]KJV30928.1 hypothetical protein VI08_14375 [Luteibacter yeojuensis]
MAPPLPTAARRLMARALLALIVLATWLAYAPGLDGTFVFDDFGNLPALGAGGPVHDMASALRYATSGKADPTGRPLATLSFLLDATDWPASPYPFKRTNLLLHLLNGVLLAGFLAALGRAMGFAGRHATNAALLAAATWLLSPLMVSTVLYVVQREAMLPATFMLLAGLCWLRARSALQPTAAVAWIVVGTGGCTLLAVLCKANGAVIPLLVLACEWALPPPHDGRFRRRLAAILGGPAVALVGGLAWLALDALGQGVLPFRGWSISQRLITEPAILWRYLGQLWLVVPTDTSVLHDGVPAARNLFSPWYTLPAIAGCVGLLALAATVRRRFPALALAIVFFFAGHAMESTSIPLELYFDHRNYLPAMLMFWPLALAVAGIQRRGGAIVAALAIVAVSGLLTRQNTQLWGDPYRQAMAWAATNPASPRSQVYAAQMAEAEGHHVVAMSVMAAATARFAEEPQVALVMIDVQCKNGRLPASELGHARSALANARSDPGSMLLNWFEGAITTARAGHCTGFAPADVAMLLDAASGNPVLHGVDGRRQDIDHLRGQLALSGGDAATAARWFDDALAAQPNPATALSQAANLGAAGRPDLALAHLDLLAQLPGPDEPRWTDGMAWIHAKVLAHQAYWASEVRHLRTTLENDRAHAPRQGTLRQ